MKMKNLYIRSIFLFLGLFLSSSCSDYLDKEDDVELTLEGVFQSKVKTENWLASCYSRIPDPTWGYTRDLGWEILADDMTPSERWRQYKWEVIPFALGDWAVNSTWGPGYWNNLPQRIRECNILIQNIKPLPEQNLPESEVKFMIAECRFLKAYYYSLLINTYGPVPFNPDEITPVDYVLSDLQVGQTPYDEIVSWIDNELKEAEKDLPTSDKDYQDKKFGRATKIMCKAVRARMLLFAASPLVNGNPEYAGHVSKDGKKLFNSSYDANKWKIAADASKDLIISAEAAGRKLYTVLNADGGIDPFLSCQKLHLVEISQGNTEVLFARPNVAAGEYDRHTAPSGSGGQGGYGVTQSLVDAFFTANDLPITDPASGYVETGFSGEDGYWTNGSTKYNQEKKDGNVINTGLVTKANTYNMYCNREPRFYLAVNFDRAWYKDGECAPDGQGRRLEFLNGGKDNNHTHDAPQNGYLARKRTDPSREPLRGYTPNRHGILYRLGETYLNYAEALNESDPGNADILIYLNKIRERAGVRTYTTGATDAKNIHVDNDQASVRKIIRMERRVELCTEGIRYDDLRRWKLAETVLNGPAYGMDFNATNPAEFYKRTVYQTRVYKKSFYWFPIFLTEIEKNPNLVQSPFWGN